MNNVYPVSKEFMNQLKIFVENLMIHIMQLKY